MKNYYAPIKDSIRIYIPLSIFIPFLVIIWLFWYPIKRELIVVWVSSTIIVIVFVSAIFIFCISDIPYATISPDGLRIVLVIIMIDCPKPILVAEL